MLLLIKPLLAFSFLATSANALFGPNCSDDMCAKDVKTFQACVKKNKCSSILQVQGKLHQLRQKKQEIEQQLHGSQRNMLQNPTLIALEKQHISLKKEYDVLDEATEDTTHTANPELYAQYQNVKSELEKIENQITQFKQQHSASPAIKTLYSQLSTIDKEIKNIKVHYPVLSH